MIEMWTNRLVSRIILWTDLGQHVGMDRRVPQENLFSPPPHLVLIVYIICILAVTACVL